MIGVGKLYRGDDAAGLAAVERLRGRVPEDVRGAALRAGAEPDASTPGRARGRRDRVTRSHRGAEPGTLHRFDASEESVPAHVFRSSTHAFGVGEAIELARALGRLPDRGRRLRHRGSPIPAGEGLTPAVGRQSREVVQQSCRSCSTSSRRSHARAGADARRYAEDRTGRTSDGAARMTRVVVRLGALSHFTPEHFREHFADAAAGTLAAGAEVDAEIAETPRTPTHATS